MHRPILWLKQTVSMRPAFFSLKTYPKSYVHTYTMLHNYILEDKLILIYH